MAPAQDRDVDGKSMFLRRSSTCAVPFADFSMFLVDMSLDEEDDQVQRLINEGEAPLCILVPF